VAPEEVAAESAGESAEVVEQHEEAAQPEVAAPLLARTASDPAPLSLDATTVMPPLSLLPPLPSSRHRGRPPVPPVSRPPVPPSRPSAAAPKAPAQDAPAPSPVGLLATVTRLPVAPLSEHFDAIAAAVEASVDLPTGQDAPEIAVEHPATEVPGLDLDLDVEVDGPGPAPQPAAVPVPAAAPRTPAEVLAGLRTLGVPERLLGSSFADDVAEQGAYAALTRALALRLPPAPVAPDGAGEVLFVVGPGVEALRAARSLAVSLRLDPDRVQWATRGDLAGLAPKGIRMTTVEAAIDRRQDVAAASTVTIVAVDAPLRTDPYWMSQMLAVWAPVAVWAVVEATRKPEDLEPWVAGLPRLDAIMVQDTDLSADPAAVLARVEAPVALIDGIRATPHRWASLLCERLETAQA
jgi:hypothetical protein